MYCVVCVLCCVLCIGYCAFVYYALRCAYGLMCICCCVMSCLYCVVCDVYFVFDDVLHDVLCIMYCPLCLSQSVLCVVYCELCFVCCVL